MEKSHKAKASTSDWVLFDHQHKNLTHSVGGKVLLQPLIVHLSLVHHTTCIVYLSPKHDREVTPLLYKERVECNFFLWWKLMINLPTRLRMDTASWKPQQTPRLYVSQTCPQYGCIPPRITRLFIILSHKTKGFHTLFFFSQFVFFKANTLTVFPDTLTISALASSALSLFLQTMWTLPPGNKTSAFIFYLCEVCNREHTCPVSTFLGYSHGSCSANSTVGSGDHKRPSHNRHIQILRLKVFTCCFVSLPGGNIKKNTLETLTFDSFFLFFLHILAWC